MTNILMPSQVHYDVSCPLANFRITSRDYGGIPTSQVFMNGKGLMDFRFLSKFCIPSILYKQN
ncbi:MAG: hypothetical protein QOC40_08300, partial [Nitrososphaeraceae archaeon]|nr:hypothetical protein [Nitrososphaeraceae archaeon]